MSNFTQDADILYESLQFLTLIFSIILIFIVYKILKELKISEKMQILVLLVMAFHPTLIILSGSINNDNLCFVLMVYVMLRLIKWYKKSSVINVILLAIVTGLCVMTKTTGAIMAIPIIYVFLLKFYKELKKSSHKRPIIEHYISMFIIFGIVSLPIGLWYHIRNYILFDQPILYVVDPNNPNLFVGDYNLFQRLNPFSKELFKLYCDPWQDYNMTIYLLKCSLFGEYQWGKSFIFEILYEIAINLNIILIYVTLIFMVKLIKSKKKKNKVWINSLILLFIFNIFSYIIVNIKLPYGCTMDFRYMTMTLFSGAMFVCFGLENVKNNKKPLFNILYKDILMLSLLLFITSDIIILCS